MTHNRKTPKWIPQQMFADKTHINVSLQHFETHNNIQYLHVRHTSIRLSNVYCMNEFYKSEWPFQEVKVGG